MRNRFRFFILPETKSNRIYTTMTTLDCVTYILNSDNMRLFVVLLISIVVISSILPLGSYDLVSAKSKKKVRESPDTSDTSSKGVTNEDNTSLSGLILIMASRNNHLGLIQVSNNPNRRTSRQD